MVRDTIGTRGREASDTFGIPIPDTLIRYVKPIDYEKQRLHIVVGIEKMTKSGE